MNCTGPYEVGKGVLIKSPEEILQEKGITAENEFYEKALDAIYEYVIPFKEEIVRLEKLKIQYERF